MTDDNFDPWSLLHWRVSCMRRSQAGPLSPVYAMCGIVRRQNGRLRGSTSLAVRASRLVSHPPLEDAIHPALVSIHHESRSFRLPPPFPPAAICSSRNNDNNRKQRIRLALDCKWPAARGRQACAKIRLFHTTPQRCVQNRSRHDMKVDSSKTPGKAPFDVYMCVQTGFHDGGMQIFVLRQKRSSREDTTRALT